MNPLPSRGFTHPRSRNFGLEGAFLNAQLDYTRAISLKDTRLLTRVAEVFVKAGADLFAAEAFAELDNLLHSSGHSRGAAGTAARARESAGRCEGARTPALAHLPTTHATVPLTAREREIALLAVAGRSSKEIAGALGLSVRTVDNHLQHAYAKLGVTTRRELARVLERD